MLKYHKVQKHFAFMFDAAPKTAMTDALSLSEGNAMAEIDEEDTLRAEWLALMERTIAFGERRGGRKVAQDIVASAQTALAGSYAAPAAAVPERQRPGRPRLTIPLEAPQPQQVRARSGAVQHIVAVTLERSIAPLKPLDIVKTAIAKDPQTDIKASSVRMALATLEKKGVVVKNNLGEWTVAPKRSGRPQLNPGALMAVHDVPLIPQPTN